MMKIILINSMSRTGTSLLYQLLYGHQNIFFPKYRIKFVCSKPFGWPFTNNDKQLNIYDLLKKTTIPINITNSTSWHSIQISNLDKIFSKDEIQIFTSFEKENLLNNLDIFKSIKFLNKLLALNPNEKKFICLHDDHSYLMGHDNQKSKGIDKVLTTIRHPFDMVASKKNMLIWHTYNQKVPAEVELKDEVLIKESMRAIFSFLIASYEYYKNSNFLPILFEHLKKNFREDILLRLCNYLEIDHLPILLSDKTNDNPEKFNELMFASSSIGYITKGEINNTINNYKISMTKRELNFLLKIFDLIDFKPYFENPSSFYNKFGNFWREFPFNKFNDLNHWFKLYKNGNYEKVFHIYSSYNYGMKNASIAFRK